MSRVLSHPLLRNPSVLIGGGILLLLLIVAVLAPLLSSYDPQAISPRFRLRAPSDQFLMGTDMLGRDVWTRVVHGARVSLLVSACVAVIALSIGLVIGLLSGYIRWLDGPMMRTMDGVMAIPGILLAIALVSLSGASLLTVIVAIVIPEIPRVARLVRGVVLSIREEPYVEAAIGLGTPTRKILVTHILPNTIAPLIVQGTYICASAILVEAILSFLGAGLPPEIPTWGNIIAEGRGVFQRAPWIILFPGAFLAVTILAVNMLGDGLRDTLDPRMKKRLGA
ncbi:ABC transporter permease [uncultured Ferrovibrio sp.]|jgi:peptide/nickel transport system permease protein|uniref:ABC transporter permease n=1 Tax=uncultured Ferrovibrio sp. TaxID=1576913 RepID=UPI002616679C|nr:ABC transporter permease [uncultured Ferrovibrio sp.]